MRLYLHIGLSGSDRLQSALVSKRKSLIKKGILFPDTPGKRNHTRLFLAATDPDHIDSLRFNRGFASANRQAALRAKLVADLSREIDSHQPDTLILSAHQLGQQLSRPSELQRLKELLTPFSKDIQIVAHIEDQASALAAHYEAQIMEGRAVPLSRELGLLSADNWWSACQFHDANPKQGHFEDVQGAPFWLDYRALQSHWEAAFGAGTLRFRSYDAALFDSAEITEELRASFDIKDRIGKVEPATAAPRPSAAGLSRARLYNAALLKLMQRRGWMIPRRLWRNLLEDLQIPGSPIAPVAAVSARFAADNKTLCAMHPDLHLPSKDAQDWHEAEPENGFRASQYLLAHMPRIAAATQQTAPADTRETLLEGLSEYARHNLPPQAIENYVALQRSALRPHNRIGRKDTGYDSAPFATAKPATCAVIVGCMKNEAPYILEWVAYHRAIGVEHFLIYTNGCDDGTDAILNRLQQMGIVEHRNNDNWRGNSPQQFALNQALKEPVLQNAEWVIHIDVDEFINVRCGNGTLQDLFDHVPDASNIAMTWRLFGNNGVDQLSDRFVIDEFDHCAPKFCPKPHTVWGFKSMVKNIGAYGKFSCHRPNKLVEEKREAVKWVNGSGQDMTKETTDKGWRSSRKSIGYDLVQLNHYALRSAESYLIKRQRGRALHVDRSIGLNYWIRMDWCDHFDPTIKRNLPRLRAEFDQLLQDDTLRQLHEQGCAWHRAKAKELKAEPEFADLYEQARQIKLNSSERVAYALALDTES
ncbi:glycosyltransferase family 2 protein [Epibacterium sp. SM1969]|uniref:Glycosyltransferase family 2 protein n=1 Tax=Tritonibacter aquimaris TaxID=2663379 RepID=A0A844AVD1_9RHOB|nr:glycosyltransferase family 2 protein [Tritonibacter aquimaris]MQY41166.1 glycosyltransferase family 2 protein [Tritonibacter aquimaris]